MPFQYHSTDGKYQKEPFFSGFKIPLFLAKYGNDSLIINDFSSRTSIKKSSKEIDSLSAIFLQKNGERRRKSSLHAFVPTKALHSKPKVFFTSSPNTGSLACEDVSFRYRSISLVKRSACAAREVFSLREY